MNKDEYDVYKANGVCVKCRTNPAVPGKVMCEACAEIARAKSRKGQAAETARLRDRRAARRAAGLCVDCGSPAEPGYTMCAECRYLKSVREKVRTMRKRKGTWTGKLLGEKEKRQIAWRVVMEWIKDGRQDKAG